jgi:site-specific DNA recombinase
MSSSQSPTARNLRCAIYTRKSTEDGLEQEFNSLDAQREAGESYIKSQGWQCLLDRFDDGGYSGATLERPAVRTLLTRIEAGQIDAVVCYKIDRISRSLRDFVKLMELLDARGIALIAVTQSFNTQTSIGRLTLNMLMSFAEFERSMISERTRDKMAATRRKGKWSGGMPLLGYDVTPTGSRLTVNEAEAEQVRTIFALYLENQSVLETAQELDGRAVEL